MKIIYQKKSAKNAAHIALKEILSIIDSFNEKQKACSIFFYEFQTKIQKPCIQHINNSVLSLA